MLYSKNADTDFDTAKDTPADMLRQYERHHRWAAQPWHFQLAEHINPARVYAFFARARYTPTTGILYFNGGEPNGKFSYAFVKAHLWMETFRALGRTEVRLAHEGEILKFFWINPKRDSPGFLKPDEIKLMFDLGKRAMAGQKIDAMAELAAHRAGRTA